MIIDHRFDCGQANRAVFSPWLGKDGDSVDDNDGGYSGKTDQSIRELSSSRLPSIGDLNLSSVFSELGLSETATSKPALLLATGVSNAVTTVIVSPTLSQSGPACRRILDHVSSLPSVSVRDRTPEEFPLIRTITELVPTSVEACVISESNIFVFLSNYSYVKPNMPWILIGLCLAGLYVLASIWSLFRNYQKARASGFNLYITIVNPSNPFWMAFSVVLRPTLSRLLPSFAWERLRRSIYGWEFNEKYSETPARPDPAFLMVTPGRNELWIEDSELANTVLTRRKDFLQFDIASLIMGIFGPNVITSDGDDWRRHRKLVAPVLNERISDLVWKDSSKQAREMLDYCLNTNEGENDETIDGLRSIAIHVLGSAGYGTSQPWKEEGQKPEAGHTLTYMEALHAVIDNFVFAALLPAQVLALGVMPEAIRKLGNAVLEFPTYTRELLEKERAVAASSPETRNNLMSTLVKASDAEKQSDSKTKQSLSEQEIMGNLFQFTLAGFDTTANTLAYAMTTVAAFPEWQDWIIEEIDHVLKPDTNIDEYEQIFPNLGRCLALMYETLRLYTPVAHISRQTKAPQQIIAATSTFHVPANTVIYVNVQGIHVDEKVWGADALEFRPTRWLSKDSTLEKPSLTLTPRGTFLPWSAGPRICPGLKMAQVEFVAVMATIFRHCRISPVVEEDETVEIAREKLKELMIDSQARITLQMNRPKDVKLKWEPR